MALTLAATPVDPPQGNAGLRLQGGGAVVAPRLDLSTLLQREAVAWVIAHRAHVDTYFRDSFQIETSAMELAVAVDGEEHVPGNDSIKALLGKGREPEVSFYPADDGKVNVKVTANGAYELHYPCNVEFSFPFKQPSETELGLLRQSLQHSLAKMANGMIDRSGHASKLAFALWSDTDLQPLIWSIDEIRSGFKVVQEPEAAALFHSLPPALKPDASEDAPDTLLLLTANKPPTPEYRDALIRAAYNNFYGERSSVAGLLLRVVNKPAGEDDFTAPLKGEIDAVIDRLAEQAAGATAYEKRVGIAKGREGIKEKAAAQKAAAAKRDQAVTAVRDFFQSYLGEDAPHPEFSGRLSQLQQAILQPLRRDDLHKAVGAIDEALSTLPEDLRPRLNSLRERLNSM